MLTVFRIHWFWGANRYLLFCATPPSVLKPFAVAFSEYGAVAEAAKSCRIVQIRSQMLLAAGKSHFAHASDNSTNARVAEYAIIRAQRNGIRRQLYVHIALQS